MKIRDSISDIFVKKISLKMGKILTREALVDLWLLSGGSKSRSAYGVGKVKNAGLIQPIGGGIYTIGREVVGIDLLYWEIIRLIIRRYAPSGAIIAHEKSMEIHLRNFEIPEKLVLYTRDTEKRLVFGPYQVHFRTLKTGEKSGTKNMYRIHLEASESINIEGVALQILSLEASLLDVASLRIHESGVADHLLLKFIAKYEKQLSREKLGELVRYRYIRAINRIRSLSKSHGYERLYEICLDIIKDEGGGCYLNL